MWSVALLFALSMAGAPAPDADRLKQELEVARTKLAAGIQLLRAGGETASPQASSQGLDLTALSQEAAKAWGACLTDAARRFSGFSRSQEMIVDVAFDACAFFEGAVGELLLLDRALKNVPDDGQGSRRILMTVRHTARADLAAYVADARGGTNLTSLSPLLGAAATQLPEQDARLGESLTGRPQ